MEGKGVSRLAGCKLAAIWLQLAEISTGSLPWSKWDSVVTTRRTLQIIITERQRLTTVERKYQRTASLSLPQFYKRNLNLKLLK